MARRLGLVAAALLITLAGGGCAGGASPTPAATASPTPGALPAGSPARSATGSTAPPATSPPVTLPPATSQSPGGAPDAGLVGLEAGPTAAGILASWTWDGAGGDGMWVVRPPAGAVRVGSPLRIVLDGAPVTSRWQAQWAATQGTSLGSPVPGGDGASNPIAIHAPGLVGSWSLAVMASFGVGRTATWTWQIEVVP